MFDRPRKKICLLILMCVCVFWGGLYKNLHVQVQFHKFFNLMFLFALLYTEYLFTAINYDNILTDRLPKCMTRPAKRRTQWL